MAKDAVRQKMKTIDYNKKYDILTIHNGFEKDERFESNIDIGDLVLDVSTTGKIRGIEILNASDFLQEWGVTKSLLKELADAKFTAIRKHNAIIISLTILASDAREIPAKIAVPVHN